MSCCEIIERGHGFFNTTSGTVSVETCLQIILTVACFTIGQTEATLLGWVTLDNSLVGAEMWLLGCS